MTIRRLLLAAAVLTVALMGLGRPAGALENADFGIDRSGGADIEVRAGKTTHGEVRLWNKTDRAITIRLWPAAATVDPSGAASLGGDGTSVSWVELADAEVTIPAHGEQKVAIDVKAPRTIEAGTKTVAIMAETVPTGDAAQAVMERLAVVTYLNPAGPASAGLGWLLWAAVAGLLAAAVGIGRTTIRRRPNLVVATA